MYIIQNRRVEPFKTQICNEERKKKKKKKEWELGIGLKPLRKSILLHISKDTSKLIGRKLQFNLKYKKRGRGELT